ncbi:hypothetical protein UFOVP419_33 [uncultured Caudovirales phage]|jgi:hypothetical protein|uniref:Uncharacterized protein n=1 Tax=uncultured Caudovirales phage TaxID=2100421 RepID=A0A6J5M8Y6_9CAUD|nr:hypothetical protein UFOVP419_33 [uncultured Caudovirales phage]
MAITTGHTSVGLTATIIDGTSNSDFRLTVHNDDNTAKVYVGGPGVTTANGLGIEKLTTMQIDMYASQELYAVSGKTGHIIHWMKQV